MRILIATLSVALITSPLSSAPPQSVRKTTWSELGPLIEGRRVEIVQKDGAMHAGKAVSVGPASIEIAPRKLRGQPVTISRDNVSQLYLIRGGGVGRTAALVGLGIGAGVLGAFGLLGALLDGPDAAVIGFAGAAASIGGAVLLAVKTRSKRIEIIVEDQP